MKYPVEKLTGMAGEPFWNLHHQHYSGMPLYFTVVPIEGRVAQVRRKPEHEVPTRLEWMRPVKGKLPKAVTDAASSVRAAQEAEVVAWDYLMKDDDDEPRRISYRAARQRMVDSYGVKDRAIRRHKKAIMALFRKECPGCPYDEKKGLLFPEAK